MADWGFIPEPWWDDDVPCRQPDVDPEWWFPVDPRSADAKRAMALCRSCHLRADCLFVAVTTPNTAGVWGGVVMSARTWRRLRTDERFG